MTLPARKRCPCGTLVAPRLEARGARRSKLCYLRCPVCRLTTAGVRGPEHLAAAWNETVDRETERMREAKEAHR